MLCFIFSCALAISLSRTTLTPRLFPMHSPQHGGLPSYRKDLSIDNEYRWRGQGLDAHRTLCYPLWVRNMGYFGEVNCMTAHAGLGQV